MGLTWRKLKQSSLELARDGGDIMNGGPVIILPTRQSSDQRYYIIYQC